MGALIVEFRPGGGVAAGVRCRFCARLLDDEADETSPDRMTPHCTAKGCRVCVECASGLTGVSPTKAGQR